MKIVHIEAGKHLYGGALQVKYLLEGLARSGVENVLVCAEGAGIAEAAAGAARIRALPMSGDLDFGFIRRLRRVLREERPDLVHIHSRRGADLFGGIAAWLERVPAILSRRVDNPEPRWWVGLKYRLYTRVITISEGIRQVLLGEGLSPDAVVCVPSAVDTDMYRPGCPDDRLREEFGLAHDEQVVGVVAQLIPRKGHRYLIDAIPEVCREVTKVRVIFFGKGPLESELKAQCQQEGRKDVIFAGFRDDLPRLLPCLDALVHPAEMEGLGVSLLQAAACGIPIIATPVGGIPEAVHDGVNGYLVPAADPPALARKLITLLNDPEQAHAFGQAGRALVEEQFSVAAMVAGNLSVYRAVLGGASVEAEGQNR